MLYDSKIIISQFVSCYFKSAPIYFHETSLIKAFPTFKLHLLMLTERARFDGRSVERKRFTGFTQSFERYNYSMLKNEYWLSNYFDFKLIAAINFKILC